MKIIPLSDVVIEKRQRTEMTPKKLQELRTSILNVGLLHPPVMWQRSDGKWVLSVGERRLKAVQTINSIPTELPIPTIRCGDQEIPPGHIAITPLGDYLDEIGRFEAELDENIHREDIPWQDRAQALADLHKMRRAQNPSQTLTATGKEIAEKGGSIKSADSGRVMISTAITISEHLHDAAIANARNQHEAMQLILKKEEERVIATLVKRKLATMGSKPLIEVRQGDLLTLLPILVSEPFDLILADPPYGIDASSAGFRARTVHHHNYSDTPTYAKEIARAIVIEGFKLTKPRANLFMFGAIETFEWWKQLASTVGWVPFNRPLIWAKSESEGLAPWGSSGPRITTEFIFYATKGQRGLVSSPIDVFRVNRVPRHERIHAAEKPVELLRALIACSTLPGESVLDPCCGSGSTLVACKELKRTGLGIEKEQTYYNTALANVHGDTNASPPEAVQGR